MKKLIILILLLRVSVGFGQAEVSWADKLCIAAIELTHQSVIYDAAYTAIPYPNGDVPSNKGVCTDVVIRAYRKLGIDLQKEVHEDMVANFAMYPKSWGAKTG